jgi:hypothetical protein
MSLLVERLELLEHKVEAVQEACLVTWCQAGAPRTSARIATLALREKGLSRQVAFGSISSGVDAAKHIVRIETEVAFHVCQQLECLKVDLDGMIDPGIVIVLGRSFVIVLVQSSGIAIALCVEVRKASIITRVVGCTDLLLLLLLHRLLILVGQQQRPKILHHGGAMRLSRLPGVHCVRRADMKGAHRHLGVVPFLDHREFELRGVAALFGVQLGGLAVRGARPQTGDLVQGF